MFDKEFDIAEIIALSQKQELTTSDEQLLQKWLEADVANPILFASLSNEDSIREKMKAFESPDSKALWANVINKLSDQDAQTKTQVRRLWPRVAIAAAIAAIIFCAGLFYYNLNINKEQSNQVALKNDVAPGKRGATLTLANGKEIRLSNAAEGELAKEAGVVITKSADGQLVYEIQHANNGESSPINVLSTTKGETYQVRLPDGSLVWLNAASSLTYSAALNKHKMREVKLIGEAYFEVAKDKLHPFIVKTERQEIEVLGTHFNVSAYKNEPIKTALAEGSVKVVTTLGQKVIIPGQQTTLKTNSLLVQDADLEEVLAWKDGDFNFNSEEITAIMATLSRWYDIEIVYQGALPKDLFSGKISRNRNLSQVLKMLEITKGVHFKIQGRRITVMK